ncbi:MAG TPA: right-handed parallel beta-helix repeat-containing protein, partial [Phycisphaerales bacterium]|nr:right-handed parallel beta-helix repeat-containing protein [Phycisphaerales bacterium]
AAFGQSFNVDLNVSAGTGAGVPTASFPGAAGQSRFWNGISTSNNAVTNLADLFGASSGVTFTRDVVGTWASADDAGIGLGTGMSHLLEDYQFLPVAGTMTYTFGNLQPGTYAVYTYAKRPGATTQSKVAVTGSVSSEQAVGGTVVNGSLLPGTTHSIHIVTLASTGSIEIKVSGVSSTAPGATCGGIQLRKLPASQQRIRFYVDGGLAAGYEDGASWLTAFRDLQTPLKQSALTGGDWCEIWCAEHTYTPAATDRSISFQIPSGLRLFGGFAGDESSTEDRGDPWSHPTVLSGNVGATNSSLDNSYHVVRASGASASTLVDGFSIVSGRADQAGGQNTGGGALINLSSLQFRKCRFRNNYSVFYGAGVFADAGSPSFVNCEFYGNWAENASGGAIYQKFGGPLRIAGTRFVQNQAGDEGGAVMLFNAAGTVAGSFFTGNVSDFGGGGAIRCGGGDGFDVTISDCTLYYNRSLQSKGGGVYVSYGADANIHNSILWANLDNSAGIFHEQQAVGEVDDESFVDYAFTTVHGLHQDPKFVDADGADNQPGTPDDNCRLQAISPCIDFGANAFIPADVLDVDGDGDTAEAYPVDLDGRPRRIQVLAVDDLGEGDAPLVDRGCYERVTDCIADFDGSGFVDIEDFNIFVGVFEAGELLADVDASGFVDLDDYDTFVNAFELGC